MAEKARVAAAEKLVNDAVGRSPPEVKVTIIEKQGLEGRIGFSTGPEAGQSRSLSTRVSETQHRSLELEDEFREVYFSMDNPHGNVLLPPYDQRALRRLVFENNTLLQCITAMEVNVDGTGFEFVRIDREDISEKDSEWIMLDSFFREPWPDTSFLMMRRQLRRDMEEVGNAYLEILNNPQDEIVMLKRVDPITMRMVRLSNPVPVKLMVDRNGVNTSINVGIRERSFVQKVGVQLVYFKEFGASRDIGAASGKWAPEGERFPADQRGTEILHFTMHRDSDTPYGVPRWINQIPSVVGSRAAEELNLDYFESKGIPPVLILVQGGIMAGEAKKDLERLLNGQMLKARAAICEIESTSGSLDAASRVDVKVERFGSEQQKDSLFENYDSASRARIRGSFRIPPLFFGEVEAFNFATAFASILVTEAQVFKPERVEFDEKMNVTVIEKMGAKDHEMRSLPLQVHDTVNQLRGVELASNRGAVDNEEMVDQINSIVGLTMTASEMELVMAGMPGAPIVPGDENGNPDEDGNTTRRGANLSTGKQPTGDGTKGNVGQQTRKEEWRKRSSPMEVVKLAKDWLKAAGYTTSEMDADTKAQIIKSINGLSAQDHTLFKSLVVLQAVPEYAEMDSGLDDLCSISTTLMAGGAEE